MVWIYSIPKYIWEFRRISFLSLFEGVGVIAITGLEFRFDAPNIMFGIAIWCDQGVVDDSFLRHSPFSWQFAELLQLQGGMVVFGSCLWLRRFLWLDIIVAILGMQLLLTFRVLRLYTFRRWWWGGSAYRRAFRNSLPMLFLTLSLKGGLNRTVLRLLFLLSARVSVASPPW